MDGEGTTEPAPDPDHPPAANASGRQLALNVASSYGNLFLAVAMSLVLTRVLLRHLGAGTYGLWIVLSGNRRLYRVCSTSACPPLPSRRWPG